MTFDDFAQAACVLAVAVMLPFSFPADAADRYAGHYQRDCGPYVCELRIEPAGAERWELRWTATDPRDFTLTPACGFEAEVEIGSARLGPVVAEGIAVGRFEGQAFGVFDLDPGRVSISSTWEACPGLPPKGIYEEAGDD